MRNMLPDNQMRALTIAMASAVTAAVATMFVPIGILEGLTGSTGLSEIMGSAKAPLGDAARALFAFGAGAITLAVLVCILLRRDRPVAADTNELSDDEVSSPVRAFFSKINMPKMPWVKDENDITELSDLPKLKNGDAHPDAPPRRPLTAHELSTVDPLEDMETQQIAGIAANSAPEVIKAEALVIVEPEQPAPVAPESLQPSLAEMVAQLEAAVAERTKQLVELELVAAQLGAGGIARTVEPVDDALLSVETLPASSAHPRLEAVPADPAKDEDMDSALAAALATLHRMNSGTR